MSTATLYAEQFTHLALGGLIVLPNARAARTLRSAFDRHQSDLAQRGLGPSAWEPARALSWLQFTTGLFNDLVLEGVEPRVLLNEAQEHHLWRETIAASQPDALTSTDSLAELARSAWHLAAAYNATLRLFSTANTADTRTFAAWAADFESHCNKSQLLSPAQLDYVLLAHLQRNSLAAPVNLHLAAFDDATPSQSALIDAFVARGTQIVQHNIEYAHPSTPLLASIVAPTERDELILAARWIRSFLLQHRAESKTVAVLVPSLDDDRAELESVFREVLAPELESLHVDLSSAPWQFASGSPLASLPLLQCVLELAHWANSSLSLDRISALLLSPFLGVSADRNIAAQFDASVLRRATLLRPELDLAALLALADSRSRVTPLPSWLRNFQLQVTRAGNLEGRRSFAEWAEFLRGLTTAVNWPGERTLTAAEFEATRAWDSVLDLLSTLDFDGRRVPLSTFIESLDRQARVTNFSGRSNHAPVQVMGMEDAAGSAFDAVLFLRATDANWPRSPKPNSLLSWSLQQELAMPGASSTATIAHARSFTTHLLARSGNLLFLSAVENADGKLRPSPLLAEFSPRPLPDDLPTSFVPEIQLENLPDDIHLPPLSSASVKGGARVLKLQAACPFQAFATIRLQSNELRDRTAGFDAIEGGVYVHNILQYFWTEVGSQKNLREMSPADRDELLHRCIESAAFAGLTVTSSWDAAYIALQKQRLHNLLSNWLWLELKRGPFVIAAMEQNESISIGPLDLRVRIDRIDRIDDPDSSEDHFVYVDYKTGSSGKPSEWALPRPDDPQLPLYALTAAPNELHAIAFAKVRSGESAQWLGYQSTHGILNNGDPVDLDAEIAAWSSALVHLAEDFAAGIADVDPKDFPATCKHCAQRLICRVNPESFLNPIDTLSNSDEESDAGALDE